MREIRDMYKKLYKEEIKITEWWAFIEVFDNNLVKETIKPLLDAEHRIEDYKRSRLYLDKVRKYCNYGGYSDWEPFEVIRVVSKKCIEIRRMKAVQTVFPSDFHAGGFCGHYTDNHNQDYNYSSDENNPIIRIRLSKSGWGNGRYHMSDRPYKFYDYNF